VGVRGYWMQLLVDGCSGILFPDYWRVVILLDSQMFSVLMLLIFLLLIHVSTLSNPSL
jgi:hypothetical protein